MKTMIIKHIARYNADGMEIFIYKDNNLIFNEEYIYGYNASYNKDFALLAERNHINAIKYGWKNASRYCLKPFIKDILDKLIKENGINQEKIYIKR